MVNKSPINYESNVSKNVFEQAFAPSTRRSNKSVCMVHQAAMKTHRVSVEEIKYCFCLPTIFTNAQDEFITRFDLRLFSKC